MSEIEKILAASILAKLDTFEGVCLLLQTSHRREPTHTPEQTLNRLFQKNLGGEKDPKIAANTPWLSGTNTTVTIEIWAKPNLRELAKRKESRLPMRTDVPVVIVHYQGRDHLIDGGSRAHAWHTAGDTSDHPACVVTVLEHPQLAVRL